MFIKSQVASTYKAYFYYKFWSTGDSTTVVIPVSTYYYRQGITFCFSGVDTTSPIHKIATQFQTSSSTLDAPSITTTVDNTFVFTFMGFVALGSSSSNSFNTTTNTSLGTFTQRLGSTVGSGVKIPAWSGTKATAGVVNATTATRMSGNTYTYDNIGSTIALTPALNTNLLADYAINVVNNPPTSNLLVTRILDAGSANLSLSGQPSELTTQTNVFATALINLNNVTGTLVGDVFDYTIVNKTLGNLTSSSTATIKISSNVLNSLSPITASITAASLIRASVSNTLADTSINSSAQFYKSAVIDIMMEPLSGIVQGVVKLSASVSKSLSNITLDSQSLLKTNGTLNQSLGSLTASATAVPFLFKNATTNVTLENVSINASEYINIAPESYFSPPAGYYLYETRFINTEPKIIYYSKDYASLLDTPTTAIGSYGEVDSFKILITVLAIYKNISDSSIILEEKKKFRFEVLPDWSIMRDQTIIDYFEGKTLSSLPPAAFIEYMKSLGYYK